jgi:hypothetical protein
MKEKTKVIRRESNATDVEIDFAALADLRDALSPHWAARVNYRADLTPHRDEH